MFGTFLCGKIDFEILPMALCWDWIQILLSTPLSGIVHVDPKYLLCSENDDRKMPDQHRLCRKVRERICPVVLYFLVVFLLFLLVLYHLDIVFLIQVFFF